jgi:two-component system chemotaxis sensor kinase CheA
MLSAKLKQEKLNIRLNLIRYVSHEMRTPLNTAFLGLGMLIEELETIHANLKQITSNNKRRQDSNLTKETETDYVEAMSENKNAIALKYLSEVINESQLEDMQDTTKQVHDSCHIALETLNDLLTFDKLDENKLVVEVEEINPWELVCEAAKPFEINAKDVNVNFSISCVNAETNWHVSNCIIADRFKLSQVIRNLVSNSLKFTPQDGYVKVVVEKVLRTGAAMMPNADPSNHYVRVSVQDSGAGISKENQKKLFGQYVQFNAAALQQGKGSGLGLWIAKSE